MESHIVHGRINLIAGGVVILLAAIGGFALGFTMDPFFARGFYAPDLPRVLIKAGHTHGMPFALYNLLVGLLVDRLTLASRWKRLCSRLALGAFSMPLGLILRGLDGGSLRFAPVVAIGALCFMATAVLIITGSRNASHN